MEEKSIKYSPLEKFLHFVEVLGNKIPNPILMFILFGWLQLLCFYPEFVHFLE